MPHTIEGWVSGLFTLGVCAWALLKGERAERIGAVAMIAATLATVLTQDRVAWMDPQRRMLTIDAALFAVFACLATMTQRRWVVVATALQLLAVMLHVLAMLHRAVGAYAYLTALAGLAYGMVIALGVGVWQVERERRSLGRVPA